MAATLSGVGITVLRLTFVLLVLFKAGLSSAGIIHAGNSYPVKTIKKAVELAQPLDTIYVQKGIYKEGNITITKSIRLLGEADAVLDGESKFEILTLSGNNFIVKGLTFKNSGYSSMNDFASIKVIDATDFVIENNTISNASFAIHISNCTKFFVKNNLITGTPREEQNTGNGIHLWKCNHALISGNKIRGHRDGIYFEFVTESEIKNNYSTKNMRYGLHFMFSNNDTYSQNRFIDNGAGVAVMFSHHVNMIKNEFENNLGASSYGILLKEISDGLIADNTFKDNSTGIFMEGASRILVEKNTFESNGWGFKIQSSCADITVEKNKFIGNTFDVVTNGTLVLNKFTHNYWDKYEGYDLNKDGIGDVPYRPVSLYSMITEKMPYSIMLFRSFMVMLLERAENAIPSLTPLDLKDDQPLMKANTL